MQKITQQFCLTYPNFRYISDLSVDLKHKNLSQTINHILSRNQLDDKDDLYQKARQQKEEEARMKAVELLQAYKAQLTKANIEKI